MAVRFTLRQLEYFVAVGEAGSIAVAAGIVNVSSPSISAAIAQLEDEFGLALFVRKHAKGLALTQAGRQFMAQAKKLLNEAQKINQLARDIAGKVQGPLALGCLLTFAQLIVPHLRREFETAFPDVHIRQSEQHQSDLFAMLRAGKIDLALTYDLDIPADLTFLPLADLPPYAIFSTTHPLAHLPVVSVRELCDHPMVLLDLPLSTDYFLSFFEQVGVKPNITERTRDMAVMRSLVANGFGYSILNIRPRNERAPDGRKLQFVPLKGDLRPMKLGLLTRAGADNVLTVRAFIEHCQAHITGSTIPGIKMNPAG
jgi:DNA-binding transcriptional LysR family regulator